MANALVFRRPLWRVALASAAALGLCPLLLWYASLLPLRSCADVRETCNVVVAGIAVLVVGGLARAARERLTLDGEGMAVRGLLGRRFVRWESVVELIAPWGLYTDVPLALKLRPRQAAGLLARLLPARMAVAGHWAGHERLVREIVARAPQARANARLRAYLAEPHRVPLSHRLVPLAFLAVAAAAAAYALADALAEGVLGLWPGAFVVALALPSALAGSSMGREWRPKAALIVGQAVLPIALLVAYVPATMHGHTHALLVLLAACFGWTLATLAVCLPWRPRGWRVAAGYALALAAAVGPTWWWGVREPVPFRATAPLRAADRSLAWSPDGHRLGIHVAGERQDYLLVDTSSLATQRLPVVDLAERLYLPSARDAAWLTCRFERDPEDGSLSAPRTLWVLHDASGEAWPAPLPTRLRVAEEGFASPDGQQAALLALGAGEKQWRLCLLRLPDLTVTRPCADLDFSRFGKVRWTPDGRLLLTEKEERKKERPARIALWSLAPTESQPRRLYEATARDLYDRYSPNVRWALITFVRRSRAWDHYEIVDLLTGESRPVEFPGKPYPHQIAWAPDGAALACVAHDREAGVATIATLDPATGALSRTPIHTDGEVQSVALSCGGRFAACKVQRARATFMRIIEMATGRLVRLRRPMFFATPIEPAWSPVGHTLAVASYENPMPPAPTIRIRLFDFASP